MAQAAQGFHCSVITPEAVVVDSQVSAVSFPAHDGEIGILRNRAPLVCEVGIGTLRLETSAGEQRWFVDGGFAEVHDNHLTILTNRARAPEAIESDVVRRELEDARSMRITDADSFAARQAALARARAQQRLLSQRGAVADSPRPKDKESS